jgi:general secretion pathway protein G
MHPVRPTRLLAQRGVTLLQLLTVVAIIGVLGTLAVPSYSDYIERSRVSRALGLLGEIEIAIRRFQVSYDGDLPDSLVEIGFDDRLDPWGNAYRYVNIVDGGSPRTDHTASPINSDYDLFSIGPDGETANALTADESADDIVRANDGGFFGVVADYSRLP